MRSYDRTFVETTFATRNKCIATSNKCLASNKKLVETRICSQPDFPHLTAIDTPFFGGSGGSGGSACPGLNTRAVRASIPLAGAWLSLQRARSRSRARCARQAESRKPKAGKAKSWRAGLRQLQVDSLVALDWIGIEVAGLGWHECRNVARIRH